MARPRILVLGAGVIGLTTAVELRARGLGVRIWARDLPPDTTSDTAGAIWFPYLCGPAEKVPAWSRTALERFRDLARRDHASGCAVVAGRMFFDAEPATPAWHDLLADFATEAAPVESGYPWMQTFTTTMIDVSLYMPYLVAELQRRGVAIEERTLSGLDEALADADIVINCTGLGSIGLAGDDTLYPVRGQTVRVSAPAPPHALIDDEGHNALAYVLPRRNDVLVGGTSQARDARTEPDASETAAILERAAHLYPPLADAAVLGVSAGLRPARPAVRLEAVAVGSRWLIHNYGHGGAGFTLSWGCAADVAAIVDGIVA